MSDQNFVQETLQMDVCNNSNPDEMNQPTHNHFKHVIGVVGSKGGVGKTFLTSLLAVELSKQGFQVGILDANFIGSSISSFFGLTGPVNIGQNSFLPFQTPSGIKIISVNLIVDDESRTIIWKEELTGNVIDQLYQEVEWGELDYLLIDLPPANSELAISIMQSISFTGILIVAHPQEISKRFALKTMRIIGEIGHPILGIVENMAFSFNLASKEKTNLFGSPKTNSQYLLPILSHIPYIAENDLLCNRGQIEAVVLPAEIDFCTAFLASITKLASLPKKVLAVKESEPVRLKTELNSQNQPDDRQETSHTGQSFSDIVIQLIRSKDNEGVMNAPDAQGHFLGKCGDRMQIDLRLIRDRILDAKFISEGCGATLACGSMITKMACSKTIDEARKINPDELVAVLGGLPDDHLHCAELAVMTLREALIDALEGHENLSR